MTQPELQNRLDVLANAAMTLLPTPLPLNATKKRAGPGGQKLIYVEGFTIITRMNELFGSLGWSSQLIDLKQVDKGWMAIVRVVVHASTAQHDGVGYGSGETEKAIKEAETDALKRACRLYGEALGNCLYEKEYEWKQLHQQHT